MAIPGVIINELDLSAYTPTGSNAIVGFIGPATRGPVNTLGEFTDEGNYVNVHGKPANGFHGMRASIRYLREGSNLRYVRIGGTLLSTAQAEILNSSDALVFTILATSSGTWANGGEVQYTITHNGSPATSFNLEVFFAGNLVATFNNLTIGTVEAAVNGNNNYVVIQVDPSATGLPAQTLDAVSGDVVRRNLSGGNDGSHASTLSEDSLTGGIGSKDSFTEAIEVASGASTLSFTSVAPIEPGSLEITIAESGPATELFDESSGGGDGTLLGDNGGSGTVDYATGEVVLSLGATASGTDATVSYKYGTIEESATVAANQLTYTGTIARPGIVSDSFRLITPRDDQLDFGDGSSRGVFEETLEGGDVVAGTVRVLAQRADNSTMQILDDGSGTLTGDVYSSTVALERHDYSGGTTPAPVFAVGEALTQAVSGATGTVVEVVSADIYIVDRTSVATFDATNNVTGGSGGGGTTPGVPGAVPEALNVVDYSTGAIKLYFVDPPRSGGAISATYKQHIEDNASGVLSGANLSSGSIDFDTGDYSLTFTLTTAGTYVPNFDDGEAIQFQYGHVAVLGVGDGVTTTFAGRLDEYPVKPGTVTVNAGAVEIPDTGSGQFVGAGGTGTINYWTGEVSITFTSAPGSGVEVNVNSDVILAQVESLRPGPSGNRASTLTDGLYVEWEDSTTLPGTFRFEVFFNDGGPLGAQSVEAFDQLRDLNDAIEKINGLAGNAGSQYVQLISTGFAGVPNETLQQMGMAGAFTSSDVIGTAIGPVKTGLELFANSDAVPLHWASAPGMSEREINQAGIDLAERQGRRIIWIYSLPDFEDFRDARDYTNGEFNAASPGGTARPTALVPRPPLATVDNSFSATFYPYVRYFDQFLNADVYEPPEGDIAGLAARTDAVTEPWFPIAGFRRGSLSVSDVRTTLTRDEIALIYGPVGGGRIEVLNPIIKEVGEGIILFGQRTMARTASSVDRIHVRWGQNVLMNRIDQAAKIFPFELADDILFREIVTRITGILQPIQNNRGLTAFHVICDATTNPPEQLAQNIVNCKVFVQWTPAAETLVFDIVLTPQGADFDALGV